MRLSPIERTTKFATTVDSLTSAFEFVMAQPDDVGEWPDIAIVPILVYGDVDDEKPTPIFEVSVSSMKEEE